MLYDQFREGIAVASPDRLPEIASALWRAFTAGVLAESCATELQAAIEARILAGRAVPPARKPARTASRPRSSASLERRRGWCAAGFLPRPVAVRFTLAETAALAVIAAEVTKRGDCRLAIDHVAALAGVARSSVKRALREARALGLITVEERRLSRWRSATNIVRIVDRAWSAWLAHRTRRPGGGGQTWSGTSTRDSPCSRNAPRNPVSLPEGQGRSGAAIVRMKRG